MRAALLLWACAGTLLGAAPADDETRRLPLPCPGPLMHYRDLGCTAVFEKEGDRCPSRYDCSHLDRRRRDKCHVNGVEYGVGEFLRKEDSNPCDVSCKCTKDGEEAAHFSCAVVDCVEDVTPGCYLKQSAGSCCPGDEVCPERPEDRPRCVVDGVTYWDGQSFDVKSEPEKSCYCMEGYTGENVEPFCVLPRHTWCHAELEHINDVYAKCAPVYTTYREPAESCSIQTRCQEGGDGVLRNSSAKSASDDTKCQFGNLTMEIGDELTPSFTSEDTCIRCTCEVPPIPTCTYGTCSRA
ncbi:uncharacterized protein LOC105696825 [Orussus abietinus]|uniref:uncharacterized protein LOC105696825 n=1 Tax=Orussus abietinus TaxID=222816 RepID=UPI0006259540|nr:uncharacterized protein LOC105696825 [Orussus abietinus]